ncbi:MAG: sensor histidine kinase [Firmicutes bacterium]|nr:sensor histidine kinase [Bacillota bacterium]
MKLFSFHSFRQRLNAAFLAVSLVPMLICSALLLQIFRLRLQTDASETAQTQLDSISQSFDALHEGFQEVLDSLQTNSLVTKALFDGTAEDSEVYTQLFSATESVRSFARFNLYDISGRWRYSTQTAPEDRTLPTNWGILSEAARAEAGTLFYSASEDPSDTAQPLLQAGALLTDRYGAPMGYLVIEVYEANLQALLGGKAGAQNELLLLDRFWRAIYCSRPAQAQSLTDALRMQLLSGLPLTGSSDEFLYTVRVHPGTGLVLVLQQPQVFTKDTLRLLYTVSALSALICVVVSILMSLQLSRTTFRPIGRLHHAIRQVGKNDLDVRVPVPEGSHDELDELAVQFNSMVVALQHNQQALLENQQALNDAQIRMLQAQLNPHFLCNTLDTMKWISKINQVPQVALMSTNLADILRFCISPDKFVPLKKELEILSRYIEIQRIRLSDSFVYHADVPQELEALMVPKMLLQPLAENAILHGLEGVEHGEITASARLLPDGTLELRVRDNGRGLPPELLGPYRPPEKQTGHLGLFNVDTILKKHYGERFGLRLENNTAGGGACIIAVLPAGRRDSQC